MQPSGQGAAARPAAPKTPLSGPASKSYNVASAWETSAALTEGQLTAADLLSRACATRPYPAHVRPAAPSAGAAAGAAAAAANGGSAGAGAGEGKAPAGEQPGSAGALGLDSVVLHSAAQFHEWHAALEGQWASRAEEKYKRQCEVLGGHLAACEELLAKVDATLALCDSLATLHAGVTSHCASLGSRCEALVGEREQLTEFATALRAKLRFFDEFEAVQAQFASAQASLDAEALLPLLSRLGESLAYVSAHPQYAESGAYASKLRQLQLRALALVKARVQAVLRAAGAAVGAAVAEATGGAPGAAPAPGAAGALPEGAEVAALYVRFRAVAEPALAGLFRELAPQAVGQPEYQRLLDDCKGLYAAARAALVAPVVKARLEAHAGQPLPVMVRYGCEALARTAALEAQLFDAFFATPTAAGAAGNGAHAPPQAPAATAAGVGVPEALSSLLDPLAQLLYDLLRPLIVQLQDIDELVELVAVLRGEVLEGTLGRRAAGGAAALRPMFGRTLADVQERLIYRCQTFVKEAVSGYQPTPQDLDYPAKLTAPAVAAAAAAAPDAAAAAAAAATGDVGATADQGAAATNGAVDAAAAAGAGTSSAAAGDAAAAAGGASADGEAAPGAEPPADAAAEQWYPPVRSALLVLSKLYRSVDARIFSGLAQEGVAAAAAAVQSAARGVTKRSSPLDAQLFLIRHLLFLREQIAAFSDVEFSAVEVDLDFSHMRDNLRRVLAGDASLFSFSANNAVVQMLGRGGPRVVTSQVDSKKEVEKALKSVCEAFIMAATKLAVEPLLSFITKVTAVKVAAASNPSLARPLREQAFAAPDKLKDIVAKVNDALSGALPDAAAKLQLYLPSAHTRAILFKPVKSNICEAHGQVAALLSAEYSPEEAAAIALTAPAELTAKLDAMC